MAHEINNPLGFVLSNLGSLELYVKSSLRCCLPTRYWKRHSLSRLRPCVKYTA
ncbi:MAG: hypothetical protein IPI83_14055 [Sphingomonadales bacterium]|nr:hypothetical protein [Sphingomonadales bacterium]